MRAFVWTLTSISLFAIGVVVGCGGSDSDNGAPVDESDGGDAGPNAGPLAITPAEARIGVLRPQTFTSTGDVTWSVEEGASGGTIDEKGKYASPAAPGVYHVVATSKLDPASRTIATVTVVPLAASVLVGKAGGAGTLDGSSSRARFSTARGIGYLPLQGGIFIVADASSHTIRKLAGGFVTTIAGSPGQRGTTDGTGAGARFDSPTSVAVDSNGKRVWVLDSGNGCVRSIDIDTGAATTFAGKCGFQGHQDSTDGTGATALLGQIDTMILGASKDALYVCEMNSSGFRGIRRIDATTGKTTSPISGLNNSCSMAANYATREVYFNDNNNEKELKKFSDPLGGPPNAPPLTSVCPSMPVGSFSSLTVDSGYGGANDVYASARAALYRCDLGSNTWSPKPFAGEAGDGRIIDGDVAQARFGRADLSAYSPEGAIFIADGNVVRRLRTSSKVVETLAGLPSSGDPVDGPRASARLTWPLAIALDEGGNVIVADQTTSAHSMNNMIRKFDVAASSLAHLSGKPIFGSLSVKPLDGSKDAATFGLPWAEVRAGGDIFVVDVYGQAIRKVRLATGDVTTLAGQLGVPGKSDGLGEAAHFKFYDRDTNLYGGAIATDGTNLYVADTGNFAIRKVVIATGEVTTIAGGAQGSENGTGTEAQFMAPAGLAFVDGVLYVADRRDHTIRRVDVATGKVSTFIGLSGEAGGADGDASEARLAGPEHLVADSIGNLYVSESTLGGSNVIRRIDIAAKRVAAFAGERYRQGFVSGPLPTTLGCPSSFAVASNGDLLVSDACDGIVSVFGAVEP